MATADVAMFDIEQWDIILEYATSRLIRPGARDQSLTLTEIQSIDFLLTLFESVHIRARVASATRRYFHFFKDVIV
tara:strand:+ start:1784 stop:2011 length:228 start_codon:yes stop_codon:yes gene_type:complete